MLDATLNSKKTTVFIGLVLVIVMALGWSRQRTQAAVSASVMYFVPTNIDELGQDPTPDDLRTIDPQEAGFSKIQEIGYTSDWKVIEELTSNGELDALIVHQTVQEAVNWELVKELFQHHGLLVAGIGMAGDELANLVGASYLYENDREYLDAQNFDYFIYNVQISGKPDDVAQIIDSNLYGNAETEKITSPAYFIASSSHSYFSEGESSIIRFLKQIDEDVNVQQNKSLGE